MSKQNMGKRNVVDQNEQENTTRSTAETPATSGWRSWFRPTRFDLLALTAVFVFGFTTLIRAFAVAFVNSGYCNSSAVYLPLSGILLAFVVAMAALLALKRLDLKRACTWALVVGASCCLSLMIRFRRIPDSVFEFVFQDQQYNSFQEFDLAGLLPGILPSTGIWPALLCIILVAGLLTWLVFTGTGIANRNINKLLNIAKQRRTGILILTAVVLFALHLVVNVLPTGIRSWQFAGSDIQIMELGFSFLIFFLILFFAFVVLIYLPAGMGSNGKRRGLKFGLITFAIIVSFAGIVPLAMFAHLQSDFFAGSMGALTACVALILYWLGIGGMSSPAGSADRKHKFLPSLWSLLVAVPLLVGLLFAFMRYDAATFLTAQGLPANAGRISESLEMARDQRRLQNRTGADIALTRLGQMPTYVVQIHDRTDANVLVEMDRQISTVQALVVVDIQPFVETVPKSPTYTVFRGGSPSSKQISDLAGSIVWFSDVDSLPKKAITDSELPAYVSFGNALNSPSQLPENFDEFLNSYIDGDSSTTITIHETDITLPQWEAIVRASQFVRIDLASVIPRVALEEWNRTASLKNVCTHYITDVINDAESLEFLIETGLSCFQYLPADHPRAPDLAFTLNGATFPYANPDNDNLSVLAERWHWIFDSDESGPTAIWLPSIEYVSLYSNELQTVTTLKLDERMLRLSNLYSRPAISLDALNSLPGLEHLSLNPGQYYNDLIFFSALSKLKHLQIQAPDRTVQRGSGFEKLTKLQSLLLYGAPDGPTQAELATLRSLKTIHIVDTEMQLDGSPELVEAIRKSIPGVKIEVIPVVEFEPVVPDSYKAHVETIRQRLLENLRAEMK